MSVSGFPSSLMDAKDANMLDSIAHEPFDFLKGKSVVVTGATGFIGGWLSAALVRLGARVSAWGRSPFHAECPMALLGIDGVAPCAVDVTDSDEVARVVDFAEPDLVVHLAAQTSVRHCLKDPRGAFQTNAIGTLNVLEAVRTCRGVPRIIVCSSHMALRETCLSDFRALDEYELPCSCDPYGTSKAAAELFARCYAQTCLAGDNRVAVVRFANAFGFGDRLEDRVVQRFVKAAKESGRIELGWRCNGRQFIYVTDLVRGLLCVAERLLSPPSGRDSSHSAPATKPLVYHFAVEQYEDPRYPFIRMDSLAYQVGVLSGAHVDARLAQDYAPGEREVQALSCQHTRKALGWDPRVSLAEGIRRLLEWHEAKAFPRAHAHAGMVSLMRAEVESILRMR